MLTKLSTNIIFKVLVLLLLNLLLTISGVSQNVNLDTLATKVDSLANSPNIQKKAAKKKSGMDLKNRAIYEADDSLIMDRYNEKAYLYHNAVVNYDGVILKAEYIELDFKKNTVYAIGVPDSTGKVIGAPIFKDAGEEYAAGIIEYNFDTKKGLISDVNKDQDEIYIWMKKGKKLPSDITYVETGHFTTCNAKHPHYRIKFNKGKVIPNDKIVTGPIFVEVEDVSFPLFFFGFIPNTSSRSNGVLIPSYGYSENRGYNLTNGGYYIGLGDHADLQLRGDIYSRGSWGLNALTRYNFRYRGNGSLNLKYAFNKYGETDTENYSEDESYFIKWSHKQDAKANPYSTFSADVNFGSTNYNKLNSTNSADYLTNTFMSSIAYSARFGNGYNFSASLNHSQNSQTGDINMTLPQISFSTPRYYPFKRKKAVGPQRWYEKISMSYKMDSKNSLNTNDSVFDQTKWEDFDNGMQHVVPISSTVSFGTFNWTNSVNLKERWYLQSVNKYYESDTTYVGEETILPGTVTETQQGFNAIHEFSYNSSITTRIYGMFMSKRNNKLAMRHVITPTLSFSYRPDFGVPPFDYWQEYTNNDGDTIRYSMYEGMMYGTPSDGMSGSIGLYFDNNFEIKIPYSKDTINGGTKKIKLVDNVRFGTRYNLAAEEFALAPLELSARTQLYKGLSIRYAGYWDFYALDSAGVRINKFIWNVNENEFLRKNSSQVNLSFNYSLTSATFNKKDEKKKKDYKSKSGTREQLDDVNTHKEDYVDFNNAWSANLGYTFSYKETFNTSQQKLEFKVVQTLNFRGSINITSKWKIGGSTGYDFLSKDLTYTSVDIYRDLHCWELMFNWIPMGYNRSYNLTLRIKSPLLQDLKLNRKRNWRDY